MKRSLLVLTVAVAACSAGGPKIEHPIDDPHGDDGGTTSGCHTDDDCGEAEVCVNCSGVGSCAPGCRRDDQCGPRNICQLGTVCQSCPCAPGWCILNPCRDDDNDGYVPGDDPTVQCPGKQRGDCDDRAPDIHPGAAELCTNYRDDNCDGKLDEADPQCTCPSQEQRCSDSWECGSVGTTGCTKGCCTPCTENKPDCSFNTGSCPQHYGVNPYDGCSYGWYCQQCNGCPSTPDPVCAVNGSTYDNSCLLGLSYSKLLHDGACLPGEGMYCDQVPGRGFSDFDGGCGPSGTLYCRSSCPTGTSCGAAQCTKKGVCIADTDCPAGLTPPAPAQCDAGTPALACVDGACVSQCR